RALSRRALRSALRPRGDCSLVVRCRSTHAPVRVVPSHLPASRFFFGRVVGARSPRSSVERSFFASATALWVAGAWSPARAGAGGSVGACGGAGAVVGPVAGGGLARPNGLRVTRTAYSAGSGAAAFGDRRVVGSAASRGMAGSTALCRGGPVPRFIAYAAAPV